MVMYVRELSDLPMCLKLEWGCILSMVPPRVGGGGT